MHPFFRPFAAFLFVVALAGCEFNDVVEGGNELLVYTYAFDGGDLVISDDGTFAFYGRGINALTDDVVEEGAVLVYADGSLLNPNDSGITWTALPVTVGVDAFDPLGIDYSITYTFSYEAGALNIDLYASEPLEWEDQARIDVKVVLIPNNAARVAGVDYTSYEAVKQAHRLADVQ